MSRLVVELEGLVLDGFDLDARAAEGLRAEIAAALRDLLADPASLPAAAPPVEPGPGLARAVATHVALAVRGGAP